MENMRHMLSNYDPSSPIILGFKFRGTWLSGGSGYVMTKETIRRFVTAILEDENKSESNRKTTCHPGLEGPEDLYLGK